MPRLNQQTWYRISEAIPKPDIFLLIKIKGANDTESSQIYRAKRVNFEYTKYGFLFVLINDYNLAQLPDEHIDEKNSFCPANVIEWCYLTS